MKKIICLLLPCFLGFSLLGVEFKCSWDPELAARHQKVFDSLKRHYLSVGCKEKDTETKAMDDYCSKYSGAHSHFLGSRIN